MSKRSEVGTLLLRVVLGIVFFANGFTKFQGGIGNTVGWFESIGIPGFLAYAVGTIELVGGLALIFWNRDSRRFSITGDYHAWRNLYGEPAGWIP